MVEIEDDICPCVSFHLEDMDPWSVPAIVVVSVVAARRRGAGESHPRRCDQECEHRAQCECPTHESSFRSGQWFGGTDRPGGERAHGRKQSMTGEKSPAVQSNVRGDRMTAVLTRARRLLGRFRSPDHKRRADPYRRRSWMQRHDAVLRKSGACPHSGKQDGGLERSGHRTGPSNHRTPRILLWLLQTVSPPPTPVKRGIASGMSRIT